MTGWFWLQISFSMQLHAVAWSCVSLELPGGGTLTVALAFRSAQHYAGFTAFVLASLIY